jgi:hypothetical protein
MVKSIHEEPHVRLERWGIMQDGHGYRLVGIHAGTGGGRVTSPLVEWNGHAQTAVTESGRQYHLVGDPDPVVATQIIVAHAARWGISGDQVAMAEPWELEEFLGPKPGSRMN